jgi:hypothetical protein
MTTFYLLLGLALMGGLLWALTQITARQRRLDAELTRLEQLSAEVTMNAEAVLERVDERIEQLTQLLAQLEARAQVAAAEQQEPGPAPPAPEGEQAPPPRKRRGRSAKARSVEVEVGAAPESGHPAPTPAQRYQELRARVSALADQGKSPAQIAQELGIPRGEVELMLNLRVKQVAT